MKNRILWFMAALTLCLWFIPFSFAEDTNKAFDMSSRSWKRFIAFWRDSAGSEMGSSQAFIGALCRQLGLREPDAPRQDDERNGYIFEKRVRIMKDGRFTTGRMDMYRQGCLIWESKQYLNSNPPAYRTRYGIERDTGRWDEAMFAARNQAEQYARALTNVDGHIPFLIVSDIAYTIDIFADFQGRGIYAPFPTAQTNRIHLEDLEKPEVQELLIAIWKDPLSLDPSRKAEQVTNEIAYELSDLAASLERSGHNADATAMFVMRCIFSMFAEDINLIPKNTFVGLLEQHRGDPEGLRLQMSLLWLTMRNGGYFPPIDEKLPQLGGYLFTETNALPLTEDQHETLARAAKSNWANVQPSIFGSLLQWVFSSKKRAKLQQDHRRETTERQSMGAHYTPPVYVERLVIPTVIEPLRLRWNRVAESALSFVDQGDYAAAVRAVESFHKLLCEEVTVLDPSCGSGNILVITYNLVKELEDEVLEALYDLGEITRAYDKKRPTVQPGQFKGIEVNIHAAAISELVLLIAHLQKHYGRYGWVTPEEPVISDIRSIEHRDAIFEFDGIQDGKCVNPRRAAPWPRCRYIVGNPPFIGTAKKMREALGDAYVDGLFKAYPELNDSVNLVCYWVHRTAEMVRTGPTERGGLITTATIGNSQNRTVLDFHLDADPSISILFAVPDHPWIDAQDGAAVRIAMLTFGRGDHVGDLATVVEEKKDIGFYNIVLENRYGFINSNLTIGTDTTDVKPLLANKGIAYSGFKPGHNAFRINTEQARGFGVLDNSIDSKIIKRYLNGYGLLNGGKDIFVIDPYNIDFETLQIEYPQIADYLFANIHEERITKENSRIVNWWEFESPRPELRKKLRVHQTYIATSAVSKHRLFTVVDSEVLPDSAIISFFTEEPMYLLGLLSSKVHTLWSAAKGGTRPSGSTVYKITEGFETFPFPEADPAVRQGISHIAAEIENRRSRLASSPHNMTLTQIYNSIGDANFDGAIGECLEDLDDLHSQLDKAVLAAYGWPEDLSDTGIVTRLHSLNAIRAMDERDGLIKCVIP